MAKSTYLELTPRTIKGLRELVERGVAHKKFFDEACHVVGVSLCTTWINEGISTKEDLIKKIEEEYNKRKTAVSHVSSRNGQELLAKVLDGEEKEDIPF